MIAFASNSLLCRAALKQTHIDAATFTFVRIFSGAVALWRQPPLRIGCATVWLIVGGGALDIFANVLYLLATRHGMLTIAATLTTEPSSSTDGR